MYSEGFCEDIRLLDCIRKVCAADDAVPEVFAFGGSREEVGEAVGFQFFQALYSAVDIVTETVAGAGKAGDDAGEFDVYAVSYYTSPSPRDATLSRMPSSA